MQRESDTLVGLSIGTSKVSAVVAERDLRYPNEVQVLGMGCCVPSRGLSKGVIVNLREATESVRRALGEATNIVGRDISSAIVAFNSLDVQSVITQGMVALGGRESRRVEGADLERAIEAAQSSLELSQNMLAVHTIPVRYMLDDRLVDEPLGMTGTRLEIMLQTVFVPKTYVQNVVTCVHQANIKIDGLVLKPLAASLGALTDEEMQAGCISLTVGGGATGLVLYQAGRPSKIISIPIGGEHITSDLASVLRISLRDAEDVKKRLFVLEEEESLKRDGIDVDLAVEIISARVEELFNDYVRVALADCSPQSFAAGVILSGGVAKTPGIMEMLESVLQMKVRAAKTCFKMPPGREGISYVSEAGLVRYPSYRNRYSHLFIDPVVSDMGTVRSTWTPTQRPEGYDDEPDDEPYSGYDGADIDDEPPEPTGENLKKFLSKLTTGFKNLF